jgi:hypothetical protein
MSEEGLSTWSRGDLCDPGRLGFVRIFSARLHRTWSPGRAGYCPLSSSLAARDPGEERHADRVNERQQYVAFGGLSLAAAVFTGLLLLFPGGARFFAPYFGTIPPLLAIAITTALGFVSLGFLLSRGWFQIRAANTLRGVGVAAAVATIFGIWQACADLFVTRFRKDINVPAPQSVLFYPAIGYVVEVLFHALPLAVLLFIVARVPEQRRPNSAALIWLCIVFVAALEPVLVHMRMGASAYVGAFVFVFTLVELGIFRRYDFVSMYAFRLVFYLWWHVIWGYVRLRWLF